MASSEQQTALSVSQDPHHQFPPPKRHMRPAVVIGGNRAVIFVYGYAGLENMAFIANALSIVIYLTSNMNFSLTKSATAVTNFMGTAYLLTLFGGFLSDTYLSRYTTCVLFGAVEVFGYVLLAVQAHLPQLRPNPCQPKNGTVCDSVNGGQTAFLLVGLYSVAIGAGGVKAALPPFGADQFDSKDRKHAVRLASFFNWFFVSCTVAAAVGVTLIAWVFADHGWDLGFGVCALAVLCGVVLVLFGKPFYRINAPEGSPYVRVAQVFVAAVRNRELPTPKMEDVLYESKEKKGGEEDGSSSNGEILGKTDQFRFLDKAAINDVENSTNRTTTQSPWRLCTVTQVEETKILIRVMPVILCTLFTNTCVAQLQTFTVQQGLTMDRNLFGFQVPASSIPVIPLVFMCILAFVYDRFFVPLARKFTGIPTGIRHLHRIGLGLILSAVSMAVAALVETERKRVATAHDMVDSVLPLPYSVFWLGFQYAISGASDLFTLVGMMEFFYSESSSGMKGLCAGITLSSLAFGYFLSSVVVRVVNEVTGGWLASNNLNRDKLDYFYWLLSALGILNFGVYLLCAYSYRYKKVESVEKKNNGEKGEERHGGYSGERVV